MSTTGPTTGNAPRRCATTTTGRRIREYRQDSGLSQSALARKAGLHHTHISRIESGDRAATREALDAIAIALDLTGKQALYLFLDAYVPERLHRHLED